MMLYQILVANYYNFDTVMLQIYSGICLRKKIMRKHLSMAYSLQKQKGVFAPQLSLDARIW